MYFYIILVPIANLDAASDFHNPSIASTLSHSTMHSYITPYHNIIMSSVHLQQPPTHG